MHPQTSTIRVLVDRVLGPAPQARGQEPLGLAAAGLVGVDDTVGADVRGAVAVGVGGALAVVIEARPPVKAVVAVIVVDAGIVTGSGAEQVVAVVAEQRIVAGAGPTAPVVMANALRTLHKTRAAGDRRGLTDAFGDVASAAVGWRDRL
jgi:hypothetical protein